MLSSVFSSATGMRVRRGGAVAAGLLVASVALVGCSDNGNELKDALDSAKTQQSAAETSASAQPSASNGAVALDPQVLEAEPAIMTIGKADAPNTITVYSDYLCPHCADFATSFETELKTKYVDTGKAKIQYRDFIVIDEQVSTAIAVYARAVALETGDYQKVHHALMEKQSEIVAGGKVNVELLVQIGEEAGADNAQELLDAAIDESNGKGVMDSHSKGRNEGVSGTPSVAVNGKLLEPEEIQNIDKFIK